MTLVLLLPVLALRWVAYRRLLTLVPLAFVFLVFLATAVFNIYRAPFSWGNVTLLSPAFHFQATVPWAWVMVGRPLLGMAIFFALVEHARNYGIRGVVAVTILLALLVAFAALVATQWNTKSAQLQFITDRLPALDNSGIAILQGGFNANEIAGALAWLTPVCAGFALYRWRPRALQAGAALAFFLLLLALFLGQSRLAIAGVIVAFGALIFLLIPNGRRRYVALAALLLFTLAEVAVMAQILEGDVTPETRAALVERRQARDEVGATNRLAMWEQALRIVRDYPLTGVGMNLFRNGTVRARYPVPTYEDRVLPHAHNEFLQIGADLGIPGLLVFAALYGVAGWMLWRGWRTGDKTAQAVAAAAGAGLLAHAVFGLGDAVTLWDRLAFVFWWVLGIAGAQYVVASARQFGVIRAARRNSG